MTVTASLYSFSSKICTKQWLVLGASAFQCMRAGFLCPNCDNFTCLHTRHDQNELDLKRWFFAKICILCKSIAGPLSQAYTRLYSFGGRIKLIICQIRHELGITYHSPNKRWLKKVRWRTQYNIEKNFKYSTVISTFSKHITIFRTLSIYIWQLICQQTTNKKLWACLFIICRIIKFFFFILLREGITLESKAVPTNRKSRRFC